MREAGTAPVQHLTRVAKPRGALGNQEHLPQRDLRERRPRRHQTFPREILGRMRRKGFIYGFKHVLQSYDLLEFGGFPKMCILTVLSK